MPEDSSDVTIIFDRAGTDSIQGTSGRDVIHGFRGDDDIFGSQGSDVAGGGAGADTFIWSAGHIGDGDTDYVMDFSLTQGDQLSFLDSLSGSFNVLSVEVENHETTEANGHDLRNNTNMANDLVITVQHSESGDTQEIVLLDTYHHIHSHDAWVDYLATLGLEFGDNTDEPEMVDMPSEDYIPTDSVFTEL